MASTTSLLKSASSASKRVQSYNDQYQAYLWNTSAQTYDDYTAYSKYLSDQSSKVSDPSQSITYANKINSAQSSYMGNEIQHQSQAVMEGNSTNQAKYDKLVQFYYQASDSGNQNLAQNLRSHIDSTSVAIQNERQASQTLARGMAADNVTTIQDYVTAQKDIVKQWGDIYAQYGAAGLNDSLHQYAQQRGLPTDPSYFDVVAGIIGTPDANGNYPPDSMLGALQTSAASLDTINANKLKLTMNQIITGSTKFDLPGVGGVSYSDIMDAVDAQRAGQNIYNIGQDSNGKNVFIKNKLDNYTWGQDSSGQMKLINTYDPRGDFSNSQLKDSTVLSRDANGNLLDSTGKVVTDVAKAAKLSYKTLLENAGFNITGTNSDGSLSVIPGNAAGSALDVTGGGQFNVVVDDSGNLRFVHTDESGTKHLYEFNTGVDANGQVSMDKNGIPNAGGLQLKELTAGNTSVFGDTGYANSHASTEGQALVKQILGQSDVNFNSNLPSTITPQGAPTPNSRALTTSDILQQGSQIQSQKTALALQSTANTQFQNNSVALQAQPTYDLNQTPVPGGSRGELKVSNAPPQPKLAVSAPAPTPAITNVGGVQPTQHISSVGVVHNTQTLTVR